MRQDERFNASRKLEKRVRESENQREKERGDGLETGQRTCLCFWHREKAFLNWNLNASEWQLTLAFV